MRRPLGVRCGAELLGTALLIGIGTGAIVAGADAGGVPQWVLAIAWFGAVAIPIQAFAAISGAHLNPAVTFGLVASGRFPSDEALPFFGSQLAGAFVGSLGVRAALGDADHLGATLPGPAGPAWVFPLEFAATFLLVLSVLYLARLRRPARRSELLLPALVVGAATYLIGPWTGSSLNPARSLAPAVLSGDPAWLWLYGLAAALAALGAGLLARGAPEPPAEADGGVSNASLLGKELRPPPPG